MKLVDYNEWPLFAYDDEIKFRIRYLTEEETKVIAKESKTKEWVDHQEETDLDWNLVRIKTARKALIGWEGLTYENFHRIHVPGKKLVLEAHEKPTDPIPFSRDMKEFLIQNCHGQVLDFIMKASRDVKTFKEAEKAKELENLGAGSPGSHGTANGQESSRSDSGKSTARDTGGSPTT